MSSATLERPRRRRLGVGAAIVLVLAVAAAAVGIGVVRSLGDAPPHGDVVAVSTEAPRAAAVYVHVFGAVAVPGLYRLDEGARVIDVVAAAGGLLPEADPGAVNLARQLSDGEQIYVPALGEQSAAGPPGTAEDGRVNLNTADVAALDTLPRVGPAIAQRIIDWRDEHGRFTSVDDLLAVPGIGAKMLSALRELVTV